MPMWFKKFIIWLRQRRDRLAFWLLGREMAIKAVCALVEQGDITEGRGAAILGCDRLQFRELLWVYKEEDDADAA